MATSSRVRPATAPAWRRLRRADPSNTDTDPKGRRGATMNKDQFRQGDVFLRRVDELPTAVRKVERDNGRIVLAYGEVTGHAHAIDDVLATLWTDDLQHRFLEVERSEGVELVHEEHSTILLPASVYEVVQQVEYTPTEIRNVAD